jgi:hypothetical protein
MFQTYGVTVRNPTSISIDVLLPIISCPYITSFVDITKRFDFEVVFNGKGFAKIDSGSSMQMFFCWEKIDFDGILRKLFSLTWQKARDVIRRIRN